MLKLGFVTENFKFKFKKMEIKIKEEIKTFYLSSLYFRTDQNNPSEYQI